MTRILIVDDAEAVRESMNAVLKKAEPTTDQLAGV